MVLLFWQKLTLNSYEIQYNKICLRFCAFFCDLVASEVQMGSSVDIMSTINILLPIIVPGKKHSIINNLERPGFTKRFLRL